MCRRLAAKTHAKPQGATRRGTPQQSATNPPHHPPQTAAPCWLRLNSKQRRSTVPGSLSREPTVLQLHTRRAGPVLHHKLSLPACLRQNETRPPTNLAQHSYIRAPHPQPEHPQECGLTEAVEQHSTCTAAPALHPKHTTCTTE